MILLYMDRHFYLKTHSHHSENSFVFFPFLDYVLIFMFSVLCFGTPINHYWMNWNNSLFFSLFSIELQFKNLNNIKVYSEKYILNPDPIYPGGSSVPVFFFPSLIFLEVVHAFCGRYCTPKCLILSFWYHSWTVIFQLLLQLHATMWLISKLTECDLVVMCAISGLRLLRSG